MKKNVYRFNEVNVASDNIVLPIYKNFVPEEEKKDVPAEEEYIGPTASELKKEAEDFKKQWEIEKKQLLDSTEEESKKIIQTAEETANSNVAKKTAEAELIVEDAQKKADEIINQAKLDAERITRESVAQADAKKEEAYKEGFTKGADDGYKDGNAEVSRLVERFHTVIDKTLERRKEILEETEQQIVDLVLLVSRKVVKVISENQKDIVIQNIQAALKKLRSRGDVTVRVNMMDLKLATEHAKDIAQQVEVQNNLTFIEDSSVEPGGCIIETDFGSIDARISSQLSELEQHILDVSPIK